MQNSPWTYPQIPVLRIATVTSPGFRSSPDLTLSTLGVVSLTQRSCLGLVKTPILGFSDLTSPLVTASAAEGLMMKSSSYGCTQFSDPGMRWTRHAQCKRMRRGGAEV